MMPKASVSTAATMFALLMAWSCPASAARTDWREMTVGHFHLVSTMGDGKTREVANQLQAFENTVGNLLNSTGRLPDVPILIYILGDSDFRKYSLVGPNAEGFFLEGEYANVIVVDGDRPFDEERVAVFHEYTHFIQRYATTIRMPPWYVEGYAMLFSSFELKKQTVTLGKVPINAAIDPTRWIPIERVLNVAQTDPEYRSERLAWEFYCESWALVHLLLLDDKNLAAPTAQYLRDMDDGISEAEAFRAFGFDKAELEKRVHAFIAQRRIMVKVMTYGSPIAIDDAPITRMTPAQADAALLRLLYLRGNPEASIAPVALAAVKENPGDSGVAALNARVAARFKHPFDVEEAAARLSKGGLDDPQLRIDVANALVTQASSTDSASASVEAERAYDILDALVRTDRPPVEAVVLWAHAARMAAKDQSQVLTILGPVTERVPRSTDVLHCLAFASEAVGDKKRARGYYNRLILVSEHPEERLWAQKQADSRRLD